MIPTSDGTVYVLHQFSNSKMNWAITGTTVTYLIGINPAGNLCVDPGNRIQKWSPAEQSGPFAGGNGLGIKRIN
jgi:hypothetical protein